MKLKWLQNAAGASVAVAVLLIGGSVAVSNEAVHTLETETGLFELSDVTPAGTAAAGGYETAAPGDMSNEAARSETFEAFTGVDTSALQNLLEAEQLFLHAADTVRSEPRNVLIVGDSSTAALRWVEGSVDLLAGFNFVLDVESCRRLVSKSCQGREGYRASTAQTVISEHPYGTFDTAVIGVGYNDNHRFFADDFDTIVTTAAAAGIETLIWLTYRETAAYTIPGRNVVSSYAHMNQELRNKAATPQPVNIVIADWWEYTSTNPEWFASDGVHYRPIAARKVAEFISEAVAAL